MFLNSHSTAKKIMMMFSDYIHALLATMRPIGLRAAITPDVGHLIRPPDLPQPGLQSVELTIPILVHGGEAQGDRRMPLGAYLQQHAQAILLQILDWKEVPKHMQQRLAKAIRQGVYNLQALLGQEDIAVDQVLLDFAQTVLAVAWDVQQGKGSTTMGRKQVKTQQANFEELCQQFVERLQAQYGTPAAAQATLSPALLVTWDSQALAAMPAHALTYIKLLIVGDDARIEQSFSSI